MIMLLKTTKWIPGAGGGGRRGGRNEGGKIDIDTFATETLRKLR